MVIPTLLTVEETAEILKTTKKVIYSYVCKTGSQGGNKRKRFPESIYIRLGRRVLFNKEKLNEWIESGAEFE